MQIHLSNTSDADQNSPDFYISAVEEMTGDLALIRACRAIGRLHDRSRTDYMLIDIDPPIIGQGYGCADDVAALVIATRLSGTTLYPVTEWPCDVFMIRILNEDIKASGYFTESDVEVIGWGTIFRRWEDAADAVRRSNALERS